MNTLVAIKRVVDVTGQVLLTDDAMGVDGTYAGYTTSAHEECAVELAVRIAAATDGSAGVVTLGDARRRRAAAHRAGGRLHGRRPHRGRPFGVRTGRRRP